MTKQLQKQLEILDAMIEELMIERNAIIVEIAREKHSGFIKRAVDSLEEASK